METNGRLVPVEGRRIAARKRLSGKGERMFRKIPTLLFVAAVGTPLVNAQFNFDVDGKSVQIHSFGSQAFLATDQNNYLTMNTSQGSFQFTDVGANISTQLTDKFRIGAQIYDRDIGQLGAWHPQLDWATGDYKFKDWFGIRGGIVKTTFGLHNDTQDFDFLQSNALLPQSIYPTDLRDALIRHRGGDVYGQISLKRFGSISYTGFAGLRVDSLYGGYIYLLHVYGLYYSHYGGLQYGGDFKWTTPVKGLLLGYSNMEENITGGGTENLEVLAGIPGIIPVSEYSKKDQANQFYGQYTIGNLTLESEYRRWWRDQEVANGSMDVTTDTRGWYALTAYRLSKYFQLSGYYSHLIANDEIPASTPDNHLYDKVVTLRIDPKHYWNVKVEGHFINGYTGANYPAGFYAQDNPQGLKPTTSMLMIRTGFNF
jgi:hypothetical protein